MKVIQIQNNLLNEIYFTNKGQINGLEKKITVSDPKFNLLCNLTEILKI